MKDKEQFPLSSKMEELEKIQAYFSSPDLDLEAGIVKVEEASKIAKEILNYLEKVESKLEAIDISENLS